MADTYDYLFKFLIIGDTCVGKTCLMNYFVEGKFKETNHTVGVEFGTKLCTITDAVIKIQIWDTAGQERFRAVTKSYYRGAIGVLLVYDITNRESFNHLTSWLTDAKSLTYGGSVIVLVGNKKDMEVEREVTFIEASKFAQENGLVFMETSAITGINVEDAFYKCAKTILFKIESGDIDPENSSSGIQIGHNTNLVLTEKNKIYLLVMVIGNHTSSAPMENEEWL